MLLQASGNGFETREGKTEGCEIRMQKVNEETTEEYSTFWKSQSLCYYGYLYGATSAKNKSF